jgi:hypothetical protein
MTNNNRIVYAEVIHDAGKIAAQLTDGVGLPGHWPIRIAKAAQVHSNGVIAVGGDDRKLVAPRVPQFGKTVQEKHQRPVAHLCYVNPDVIYGYPRMRGAWFSRIRDVSVCCVVRMDLRTDCCMFVVAASAGNDTHSGDRDDDEQNSSGHYWQPL